MTQVRTRVAKGIEAAEIDGVGTIAIPRVSVEVALYAVLLVVAGLLRLYALGRQPLEHGEAEMAWSVWRFYRGQPGASVLNYVQPTSHEMSGVLNAPLPFFGSVLAFLVFETSDMAARLVPAAFGTLLVVLPYFLRRQLGRWGALVTSALLVVSPSVVFFSRLLSPAIPAVTTALAFLAALFGYLESREPRYLYAAAVTLALSLTAGPAIYTILLALAILALVVVSMSRRRSNSHSTTYVRTQFGNRQSTIRIPQSARALGLFAATFALLSTGFLSDYRGLQASVDLFAQWLQGFVPGGDLGWSYVIQVLLSYESVSLVFGVIGAVYFLWRRDRFAMLLTVWLGLALLMYSLAGARQPADVVITVVPLILLAGMAIGRLLEAVVENATLETEGFLALLMLTVGAFLYLQLAGYALRGQPGFVRLALGAVVLLLGLMGIFLYWSGTEPTLRGAGVATVLLLGALSCHASFNLNLRWPDAPTELLRPRSTSSDVRQLVRLLEGISNDRQRYRYSIGITADESLEPILPWYLRRFEQVEFTDLGRETASTPVVIAPAELDPSIGVSYIGQRFRLETSWRFSAASWRDRWRWYLFRGTLVEPQARDIVLYVGR